jgi:hypothetical protein
VAAEVPAVTVHRAIRQLTVLAEHVMPALAMGGLQVAALVRHRKYVATTWVCLIAVKARWVVFFRQYLSL